MDLCEEQTAKEKPTTACELLAECSFFKAYSQRHSELCNNMIAEYCRGARQNLCKRKQHLLKHSEHPSENMLPSGSIIRLDARIFCQDQFGPDATDSIEDSSDPRRVAKDEIPPTGIPGCNSMELMMKKRETERSDMKVLAGTGMSTSRDAADAGREAAQAAVAGLGGQQPALVIVFTTPKYNLSELLAGIRSVTGSAILIGATGSGQIVQGGHMGFGAGVGVLVLTAGEYRFGIASAEHIRGNLDRAGQEIARASSVAAGPSPYSTVLLLADCLAGDLQELVQGIYRITGPKTPIVGGAAGDELKFVKTSVFHNEKVVEEGAVALWIGSNKPLQVITRHGWEPIGIPMLVTRAEGTEIIELGGRPAAVAYEDQLELPLGKLSPEEFWDTSITHPLGMLQNDGSSVIRVARSKTGEGKLMIQGCVPPSGSAVQVMTGNADTLLDIVEDVANTAIGANPDAAALLVFSCAARKVIFGERVSEEARRLQAAAGEIPVFGLYCCGEFARSVGVFGTHNATLTALAL